MADDTADRHTAPLGHSISAHRVHGWCSHCRGHGPFEELVAWRADANERHAAEDPDSETPLVVDVHTMQASCPECGQSDSVLESSFTATTRGGVQKIGTLVFCLECEATPALPTKEGTGHGGS